MKIGEVRHGLNRVVLRCTSTGQVPYLFTGCTLRRDEQGYYYQAELLDLKNKNSVLICRLEEIEEPPKPEMQGRGSKNEA